jgi:hypothetical protein
MRPTDENPIQPRASLTVIVCAIIEISERLRSREGDVGLRYCVVDDFDEVGSGCDMRGGDGISGPRMSSHVQHRSNIHPKNRPFEIREAPHIRNHEGLAAQSIVT